MRRSPFSGDNQEVGSKHPTLWEAGEEPQVMGAKTRSEAPASLNLNILAHHTPIDWSA
jgi:hypothetical protein